MAAVSRLGECVREACRSFLNHLLDSEPAVLKALGVYKQRRQYLEKTRDSSKNLPPLDIIMGALLLLEREIVLDCAMSGLFQEEDVPPKRVVLRVVREYSASGEAAQDVRPSLRSQQTAPKPIQMSLFASITFSGGVDAEIVHDNITKKGPNRVELDVGLHIRPTGT
jgi:hypothetical protein